MSLVTINHDNCRRDGSCKAVCPVDLFTFDGEGFPEFRKGADSSCIACGHCVAVCPQDAARHAKISHADSPLIDRSLEVQPEALVQLIKSRRSTREFRQEAVSEDTIATLINAVRRAPTAVNRQPVKWLVIRSSTEANLLAGMVIDWLRQTGGASRYAHFIDHWEQGRDMILRGAPHLAVTFAPNDWNWSQIDCTIALANFEIAATAHNIGTCWAGLLMWAAREHQPLRDALGIPAAHGVYGAMMFGVPRYQYRRIPSRQEASIEWR